MGTGRIAAGVLPLLAAARGCEITAIASRERHRAEELATAGGLRNPGRSACTYEELPERDDVDAVYITILNNLHFEWCRRLLEAGKHVLCEKPLVATRAQAELLREAAQRADRLCVEGLMYLHHPQMQRLAQLASGGGSSAIGTLRRIRSSRNVHTTDEYILKTRLSHAMHGGSLMDIGCYPISAARLLAASEMKPETLRASAEWAEPRAGEPPGNRVDAGCAFSWTFENGVEFSGECSFIKGRAGIDIFLELIGDKGSAYTTHPFSPDPVRQAILVNDREEVFVNAGDKFTNQFERFAAAARGEAEPLPTIDWSIGQAATIEAIHRAIGLIF